MNWNMLGHIKEKTGSKVSGVYLELYGSPEMPCEDEIESAVRDPVTGEPVPC